MNTPQITIILLNYRRSKNVRQIISSLKQQTVQSTIFLWDNSEENDHFDGVDWLIKSSVNMYCWPRWFMASSATTKYIMTLDDDLILTSKNALERILEELEKLDDKYRILGPEGVYLKPGKGYFPTYPRPINRSWIDPNLQSSQHLKKVKEDSYVDIIKGRCMAMNSESVKQRLPIQAFKNDICDDIVVSALFAQGRSAHHIVPASFSDLFENLPLMNASMALSVKNDWNSIRDHAREFYFSF